MCPWGLGPRGQGCPTGLSDIHLTASGGRWGLWLQWLLIQWDMVVWDGGEFDATAGSLGLPTSFL